MKYSSLFAPFPYVPNKCCGAEVAIGAGLGVASLFGTLATNSSNRSINNSNQSFNAEEAEKNRQFVKDEWTRQYGIQRDEWYNQLYAQSQEQWKNFLRQAEYNSPVNQVGRLSDAGLNPSALLGPQGSSGLVSAATGNLASIPSPSVPSGGSLQGSQASAPAPLAMQSPGLGFLNSVGSFIKDIASASKDSALTQPMVDLLASQVLSQDLKNSWQQLENEILSQTKSIKVKQAFQDLKNSFMEYTLKKTLDKSYSEDIVLKKAESALAIARKNCTDKEYEVLQFQVEHMFETWTTQLAYQQSQTSANYALSGYYGSLKATEDQLRDYKVKNADVLNQIQTSEAEIQKNEASLSTLLKDAKYQNQLVTLAQSAEQSRILTSDAQVRLDKAIKENDYWLIRQILFPVIELNQNNMKILSGAAGSFIP